MTCLSDITNAKGHSLMFWNVRSINPRLEEIDRIIDLGKPEFFGIVETWLNTSTNNNEVSFDKYLMYRSDRTAESKKKGGGGLIMYYRDNLKVKYI